VPKVTEIVMSTTFQGKEKVVTLPLSPLRIKTYLLLTYYTNIIY
jgi:hypothetical protein